jgi:hypothetical protein
MIRDRTIIGRVINTAAAIKPPQSTAAYPTKPYIAIGSVVVLAPVSTSENMKLFHENINDNNAEVIMPGTEMGRTILKKLSQCGQPSTQDASSRVLGILSKNGTITHMMNGKVIRRWLIISAVKVLVKPILRNNIYQGTKKVIPGIMRTTRITRLVLYIFQCEIEYAAGRPIKSPIPVAIIAT